MQQITLSKAGSHNIGYIEFVVPEHDGPYALTWRERGTNSTNAVATFQVFPA